MASDARYCTQCGVIRTEDDADGNVVAACDEFGECRFCGSDTAAWEQLTEHLAAQGLHLVNAADKAVLDALDKTSLGDLQFLPGLDGILDGVYYAVLTRLQENGRGDAQVDCLLAREANR